MMEKLNIIELIANTEFDEKGFHELIDPEGSLDKESRQRYWALFGSVQQNLISFYKALDAGKSEVEYIKRSINSFFDQKAAEHINKQEDDSNAANSSDKIRPMDDLEGSASWGFNDDVKWK